MKILFTYLHIIADSLPCQDQRPKVVFPKFLSGVLKYYNDVDDSHLNI